MKAQDENHAREGRFGRSLVAAEAEPATALDMAAKVVRRVLTVRYDRPSLVSELACEIGAEIINWVRKPGDDLNSVELSARYQTSRVSTREALMLLEKEGLVEIPARRRPRVATLQLDEIREIYMARIALVELVCQEVALHASDDQIERLGRQVELMQGWAHSGDLDSYLWGSVEFHEMNTSFSRNRTIKKMLDSLLLRTLSLRHLGLGQPGGMERSCRDHFNLVQAYRDRDPRLARAIVSSNISNALARIETGLSGLGRPQSIP